MSEEVIYRHGVDDPAEILKKMTVPGPRIALFNKVSGAFVMMVGANSEESLDPTYFKWKKIDHFDQTIHVWEGDYDNGQLVEQGDQPSMVMEDSVDSQAGFVIRDVYQWYHQTNALIAVVKALIEKNELSGPEVDAFTDMADYIEERRDANERYKKAYSDGSDWKLVTKEESWALQNKQLEGGLHEKIGPKSTVEPHQNQPGEENDGGRPWNPLG